MRTFDEAAASGRAEGGSYLLEVKAADYIAVASCETIVVGDFALEVDASVLTPPEKGNYYFGLAFRVSGLERYAYVLGSEGGYCLYYALDMFVRALTGSTDFAAQCWALVPQDAQAEGTRHLRVVAVEDRIELYLNGILLAIARDRKLMQGWVGFTAATGESGGLVVSFDNLRIERPPD